MMHIIAFIRRIFRRRRVVRVISNVRGME